MTQCCVQKVMCVTLSTLYISYVRMHMVTLRYLLQEIFMLMSSCISTIERIFLMNFSIRNYSSCPIIGESHNICVSCSCPWAVPFLTISTSSLTGAFFMRVETRTFALSLVLLFSTFGAVFTEFGTYGFR